MRYYVEFCQRTETKLQDIARVVANREQEILHCYEWSIGFACEDFMRMVILDSIFIIEHFIRATSGGENENNTGSKDRKPWLKGNIMLDLILLENQLPFLFSMSFMRNFSEKKVMIPFLTLPANISGSIYFPRRSKDHLRRK